MAGLEAAWAKHRVHLAPEPPGDRSGIILPDGSSADSGDEAISDVAAGHRLTMLAVGDSMVGGCGVADQSEGLVPDLARGVAAISDLPVEWQAQGKLGATMRRVRYRMLPELNGYWDILFLCAGSNDIMARRSVEQWSDDLAESIFQAKQLCTHLVVLSSGQVHRCPSFGPSLQHVIEGMLDEQTQASRQVCDREGVEYVDLTHAYIVTANPEFWGSDHFHPSAYGYQRIADRVLVQIAPQVPQWVDACTPLHPSCCA